MSITSVSNNFNQYEQPSAVDSSTEALPPAQTHYFGALNVPSALNLFFAPSDIVSSVNDAIHSEETSDEEGTLDNNVRLIESPFNIVSSSFSNIELVVKILSFFSVNSARISILTSMLKNVPVLGLIVCLFESVLEGGGLKRALAMRSSLNLPDTSLRNGRLDAAIWKSLKFLNDEYCAASATKEYETVPATAKERRLIRRIFPRCAAIVKQQVPQLLSEYRTKNRQEWRREAQELLSDVKTQVDKKVLLHVVGLLAVAITIAGLIAAMCACPYAIPITLLIISAVFSTSHCLMSAGMMDTKGYHFSASNLVPQCIKNLYHKIFTQSVPREKYEIEVPWLVL